MSFLNGEEDRRLCAPAVEDIPFIRDARGKAYYFVCLFYVAALLGLKPSRLCPVHQPLLCTGRMLLLLNERSLTERLYCASWISFLWIEKRPGYKTAHGGFFDFAVIYISLCLVFTRQHPSTI
jgi:hypothetical protein